MKTKILDMYKDGMPPIAIAEKIGRSRSFVYKILRGSGITIAFSKSVIRKSRMDRVNQMFQEGIYSYEDIATDVGISVFTVKAYITALKKGDNPLKSVSITKRSSRPPACVNCGFKTRSLEYFRKEWLCEDCLSPGDYITEEYVLRNLKKAKDDLCMG